MRCIEAGWPRARTAWVACLTACVLVACDKPQPTGVSPAPEAASQAAPAAAPQAASRVEAASEAALAPAASAPMSAASSSVPAAAASTPEASTSALPTRARGSSPTAVRLPPPGPVHSWNEVRLQAAHRMVAAQPTRSYMAKSPDPLLAIPVLEVELDADGSVRRIVVIRYPRQAKDTTQIAIDAVRRAAPYGDVSRLPRPWRFTETFLFDDERRFKPRSLD